MTAAPKAVIGVPLYNRADFLPEALESLLSQTERNLALVLVDDGSTDRTPEIAQRYAALDPRITYRRNPERLGMIGNWRRAFELARELYPDSPYFAWGSDHDVWHPRWLAAMVAELDRHPELALAYPLNLRISGTGESLRGPWTFETFGVRGTGERLWRAGWGMSAGNMVYGLFRASVLAQAGVFRRVVGPDRLLLVETALYGQFRQVPEILWFRRFAGLSSGPRQRAALFPDGVPLHAYLPFWLVHSGALAWYLGVRGAGRPAIGRAHGFLYALEYLPIGILVDLRTGPPGRWVRQVARICRRTGRALRPARRMVRQRLGTVRKRLARLGPASQRLLARLGRTRKRRLVSLRPTLRRLLARLRTVPRRLLARLRRLGPAGLSARKG